jgi:hypothetical protein
MSRDKMASGRVILTFQLAATFLERPTPPVLTLKV